jgi:uncharacterized membrane protein
MSGDLDAADRPLPGRVAAAAVALFAALWGLALLRHHTLLGSYDLGYFDQAGWLLRHGRTPFVTVRGIHLLGDHGSFAFYPMAFLGRGVAGLLAVQAALLAAGAVPLWLIGRRMSGLSKPACWALLGAYALYPAVSNVDLFDFHPEALVVPALLGAVWFALGVRTPEGNRRTWPSTVAYFVCVAAVLACREDVAVTVACLGLLVAVEGRRVLGLTTVALALAWMAVDLAVVLPHFAGGSYVQGNRFGQYGATLGSAGRFMLGHPLTVAGDFATKPNAYVLLGLLAPLLFLPLLAPKYLLPGLPLQLAYLLTNVPAAHSLTAQYTVTTIPFVFVACAFGLRRVEHLRRLLVVTAAVGFVIFATASPRHEPWRWAHRDRVDRARLAAAAMIPSDAPVSSTIRMWPLLAERADLYNFPIPYELYDPQSRDPKPLAVRQAQIHWIVLDTADRQQWTGLEAGARLRLLAPDNPLGFHVVFDRAGIVVYKR